MTDERNVAVTMERLRKADQEAAEDSWDELREDIILICDALAQAQQGREGWENAKNSVEAAFRAHAGAEWRDVGKEMSESNNYGWSTRVSLALQAVIERAENDKAEAQQEIARLREDSDFTALLEHHQATEAENATLRALAATLARTLVCQYSSEPMMSCADEAAFRKSRKHTSCECAPCKLWCSDGVQELRKEKP